MYSSFAVEPSILLSGKRLSAGNTPVASYQACSCAGSCSHARNAAAAFLCCDHDVMNASEDCVVV